MKRQRRDIMGCALAALLVAAACVPTLREPEVDLVGVRLGGLGLRGGLVYVELHVTNPNTFVLVADGLTYDLDLSDPDGGDGWADLAEGTFEDDFRVDARDTASVEIPVEFRYGGVGGLFRSVIRTGTFRYRVRGRVALDSPVGTEVPYDREGIVSIADDRR